MEQESYIFETYYRVPDNSIKVETRDTVSSVDIEIIKYILSREFPDLKYEIRYLPSEEGSFREKLILTVVGVGGTGCFSLAAIGLTHVLSTPSQEEIDRQERQEVVQNRDTCVNHYDEISNANMLEYCNHNYTKNRQTKKHKTLKRDSEVEYNSISVEHKGEVLYTKKTERSEYDNFIKPIASDKHTERLVGTIDVIAPVIKQDRNGRGIQWRGIFYGDELKFEGESIISNEESISFYMQDKEYKKQIKDGEKVFGNSEIVSVILEVKFEYDGEKVKNKAFYLKQIVDHDASLEVALKEYNQDQEDDKKADLSDLPMTKYFNGDAS